MSLDDLRAQYLETWQINSRLNVFLLEAVHDSDLELKAAKGKTVAAHFTHIHNVRLMWLKAAAPDLHEGLTKFEGECPREALLTGLSESSAAIEALLSRGWDEGRIKGFKPHPLAFLGYIIAHEAYHRSQAELALRLAGSPLSDKVAYGLWEWGSR